MFKRRVSFVFACIFSVLTLAVSHVFADTPNITITENTAPEIREKYDALISAQQKSREIYQDYTSALADNAQKMHEKETSLANRTIGAVGIGATGIGGTMVGGALSEKASDDESERAMRAYLETFTCEYGDGKTVRGGETNVELPGGNDMIALYTEYAQIANDLKIRKEALGLRPGIEAEVPIDKADTGLYDDVGVGISGGAYASIARALLNPDGEDAKKWAEQRAKTEQNLKAGAITAGVGAVGSAIANYIENKDAPKESSAQIKAEYESQLAAADSEAKQAEQELNTAIADNKKRVDEYNENLVAQQNAAATMTNQTCTNPFAEQIAALSKISTINDPYYDVSGAPTVPNISEQKTIYDHCVSCMTEIMGQYDFETDECECVEPLPDLIDGRCMPHISDDIEIVDDDIFIDDDTNTPLDDGSAIVVPITSHTTGTDGQTTGADDAAKGTPEEEQIAENQCPAVNPRLRTITDKDYVGGFCKYGHVTIGKIYKITSGDNAGTCSCTAIACEAGYDVQGGRCVEKANAAATISSAEQDPPQTVNLQYKHVCTTDRGKTGKNEHCINDFAKLAVLPMQSVGMAMEYARVRDKRTILCNDQDTYSNTATAVSSGGTAGATTTSRKLGQYLACTTKDGQHLYDFAFKSTDETGDNAIRKNAADAICTIHNVKSHPSATGKCYYKNNLQSRKNDGPQLSGCEGAYCDATDENNCKQIGKTANQFGYSTVWWANHCYISFNDTSNPYGNGGLGYVLKTAYGINNMEFCSRSIQVKGSSAIINMLEEYTKQNANAKITSFTCAASPRKFEKGPCGGNDDDVVTCWANGKQIDFVFDDVSESWRSIAAGGQQGMSCIVGGGAYSGKRCIGLGQEMCEALGKANLTNCPECRAAYWDTKTESCLLPSSATATNIQKGIDVAVVVGTTVVAAAITIASVGTASGAAAAGVTYVLVGIETTGAAMETYAQVKINKVADNFLVQSNKCKESSCAKEILKQDFMHIARSSSDFTDAEAKVAGSEIERLIGLISNDNDFYADILNEYDTNKDGTLTFDDKHGWTTEQVFRAIGIGLQIVPSLAYGGAKLMAKNSNRFAGALGKLETKLNRAFTSGDVYWDASVKRWRSRSTGRFARNPNASAATTATTTPGRATATTAGGATTTAETATSTARQLTSQQAKRLAELDAREAEIVAEQAKNPGASRAAQLREELTRVRQEKNQIRNAAGITAETEAAARAAAEKAGELQRAESDLAAARQELAEYEEWAAKNPGASKQGTAVARKQALEKKVADAEKRVADLGGDVKPAGATTATTTKTEPATTGKQAETATTGARTTTTTAGSATSNLDDIAELRKMVSSDFDSQLAAVKTQAGTLGAKVPKNNLTNAQWQKLNEALAKDNVQFVDASNGYMQFFRTKANEAEINTLINAAKKPTGAEVFLHEKRFTPQEIERINKSIAPNNARYVSQGDGFFKLVFNNTFNVSTAAKNFAGKVGKYNVYLEKLPTATGGTSEIVNITDRAVVVVNINGHRLPFYVSSGQAGKDALGIASGKWYPIAGIGEKSSTWGWFNKMPDMNNNPVRELDDIVARLQQYIDAPTLKRLALAQDDTIPYAAESARKIINSEFPNGVVPYLDSSTQRGVGNMPTQYKDLYDQNIQRIYNIFNSPSSSGATTGTRAGTTAGRGATGAAAAGADSGRAALRAKASGKFESYLSDVKTGAKNGNPGFPKSRMTNDEWAELSKQMESEGIVFREETEGGKTYMRMYTREQLAAKQAEEARAAAAATKAEYVAPTTRTTTVDELKANLEQRRLSFLEEHPEAMNIVGETGSDAMVAEKFPEYKRIMDDLDEINAMTRTPKSTYIAPTASTINTPSQESLVFAKQHDLNIIDPRTLSDEDLAYYILWEKYAPKNESFAAFKRKGTIDEVREMTKTMRTQEELAATASADLDDMYKTRRNLRTRQADIGDKIDSETDPNKLMALWEDKEHITQDLKFLDENIQNYENGIYLTSNYSTWDPEITKTYNSFQQEYKQIDAAAKAAKHEAALIKNQELKDLDKFDGWERSIQESLVDQRYKATLEQIEKTQADKLDDLSKRYIRETEAKTKWRAWLDDGSLSQDDYDRFIKERKWESGNIDEWGQRFERLSYGQKYTILENLDNIINERADIYTRVITSDPELVAWAKSFNPANKAKNEEMGQRILNQFAKESHNQPQKFRTATEYKQLHPDEKITWDAMSDAYNNVWMDMDKNSTFDEFIENLSHEQAHAIDKANPNDGALGSQLLQLGRNINYNTEEYAFYRARLTEVSSWKLGPKVAQRVVEALSKI